MVKLKHCCAESSHAKMRCADERVLKTTKQTKPETNFCFCKRHFLELDATYGDLKEVKQGSFLFLMAPLKNVCHFKLVISHASFTAQQNASIIPHYWHDYCFKESCFIQLGMLYVAKGWRKQFVCSFFVHSGLCLWPVNSKLELTRLRDHLVAMCKKVCAFALTAEV